MATPFPEDCKREATRFFKRFDANNDGTLRRKDELVAALCAFGCDLDEKGMEFLTKTFDVDGNGDGKIQIEELVDHLHELIQFSVNGVQLQEAFKRFDLNDDGRISSRELKKVLKLDGPNKMSEEDASELVLELLAKYDTNGDKYFSCKELARMLYGEGTSSMPESIKQLLFDRNSQQVLAQKSE